MSFWNDAECIAADKKLLESTYEATMNVYCLEKKMREGFAEEEKRLKYAAVPCGYSYLSGGLSADADLAAAEQVCKIFCPDEYTVPAGALLEITDSSGTFTLTRTGAAKHYLSHQELTAIRSLQ